MKYLILFSFLCLGILSSNAAILTVSNDPAQPAQYPHPSDAITAASSGDTIYIHGSTAVYAGPNVNIDKQLVLIGPGRFPQKDRPIRAIIDFSIVLQTGGDGSQFLGLYCQRGFVTGSITNNVLIQGCFFKQAVNATNSSGWIIKDCIVRPETGSVNPYAFFMTGSTNLLVENCVIGGSMRQFTNSTFRNNVFIQNTSGFGSIYSGACSGNLFENNIFYGVNVQNQIGNTYNNNLMFGSGVNDTIPIGNITSNNLISQDPDFVNAPLSVTNITFRTNDFNLKAGSPAIGAGVGGVDLGFKGGNSPGTISGEPFVPQIRSMILDNTIVPAGGDINVQLISTKAEGQ